MNNNNNVETIFFFLVLSLLLVLLLLLTNFKFFLLSYRERTKLLNIACKIGYERALYEWRVNKTERSERTMASLCDGINLCVQFCRILSGLRMRYTEIEAYLKKKAALPINCVAILSRKGNIFRLFL